MRIRSFIFISLALSVTGSALANVQDQVKIPTPKVTSSFVMPKKPKNTAPIGAFSTGGEAKPIEVDGETRKKLNDLAKLYGQVARENYPLIIRTLHMEKAPASKPVKIVVTYSYNGVAATSGAGFGAAKTGAVIEVSAKYALAHPKDVGMIVHEMVHVVQSYPTYDPVWLVEGIADYVRWFNYEAVDHRPHPNPAKANARDSYQTTGAFLDWATKKYDPDLVPKLNAAFQANAYKESLFKDYTGKTLDELNDEWKASLQG